MEVSFADLFVCLQNKDGTTKKKNSTVKQQRQQKLKYFLFRISEAQSRSQKVEIKRK
jgi:hypothetical protein